VSDPVRSGKRVPSERCADAEHQAPSTGAPAGVAPMARWRLRLFAWLAAHEAPEVVALGLPPERVITVDEALEARLGRPCHRRSKTLSSCEFRPR
jgi:hypothetical protein